MSVIVKNMKMPQNCYECRFMESIQRVDGDERFICLAFLKEITDLKERLDTCPLIELPDHGRLIDADKVIAEAKSGLYWWETEQQIPGILEEIPTVIPAERSEEGSLCGECDRMYTQDCCYCARMEGGEDATD